MLDKMLDKIKCKSNNLGYWIYILCPYLAIMNSIRMNEHNLLSTAISCWGHNTQVIINGFVKV